MNKDKTCIIDGCQKVVCAKDLCSMHYKRKARHGDPTIKLTNLGVGYYLCNGYKYMYRNGKSRGEHVWVMEDYLGRALYPKETVHHKNGDRLDNRVENLEVWSRAHPPGQRPEDLVTWAKEILKRYDP